MKHGLVITFEQLLKAVPQLFIEIEDLKRLILEKGNEPQPDPDQLLTVQDAAKFLTLSVPTIYGLIHKGELPVMKRSKRCYFSKVDLANYLKAGRKKTVSEIAAEAEQFLGKKKRAAMRNTNNPLKHKRQGKDTTRQNQRQTIFEYLQKHVATASMVASATGVPQKNICRYKRNLEKAGQIWETTKTTCKETGFKAWYLTTNKAKGPKCSTQ